MAEPGLLEQRGDRMTVDFRIRKAPSYRVASQRWKGPWSESRIHAEFRKVQAWAKAQGLRTGVWVFREPAERTWEVMVEVRGSARTSGPYRLRKVAASRVASVVFDPNVVAPRVVYHGISDWLRWRRKDGTIHRIGSYREVYSGDPWTNPKAWARTEIQVEVR